MLFACRKQEGTGPVLGVKEIAKLAKTEGAHSVHRPGGYLVRKGNSIAWKFRNSRQDAKHTWIGLGPYPAISVAEALVKFQDCQRIVLAGGDPWEEINASRLATRPKSDRQYFRVAADNYISIHQAEWRGVNTEAEWRGLFDRYAYPSIGDLLCGEIGYDHVLAVLRPIWIGKTVSAVRLRQRIAKVLEASRGKPGGLPPDMRNPAGWTRLQHDLPKPGKLMKVAKVPHGALPYDQAAAVVAQAFADFDKELSAAILLAAILTALRAKPLRHAVWGDVDLDKTIWAIPAYNDKPGEPYRLPISTGLVRVLRMQRERHPEAAANDFVFPGRDGTAMQSESGMLRLIKRYGYTVTQHGFRSTFRDWAGEETDHQSDIAEAALTHVFGATRAAYQRGDLFVKRSSLMQDWSGYLTTG
jgi:integrase